MLLACISNRQQTVTFTTDVDMQTFTGVIYDENLVFLVARVSYVRVTARCDDEEFVCKPKHRQRNRKSADYASSNRKAMRRL